MPSPLEIYLQNHEAAAQAGLDLFRRVASSQRRRPYGPELKTLLADIKADLASLREVMKRYDARPNPALAVALRLGERVGRLKPNGAVLQRAPLTDLVEIEGLLDAVHAKASGWQSLSAAAADPVETAEYEALLTRAQEQIAVLVGIHRQVAAKILDLN